MSRLFWKFFLSYWGALLLGVLGVSSTLWFYQLANVGGSRWLESGPRTSFVLSTTAATLEHGGASALRDLFHGLEGSLFVLVVDESGRDLLGRAVEREALAHARASNDPAVVRRVALPDGRNFVLFSPRSEAPWQQRLLGGPPPPMLPLIASLFASLAFGALLAWYVTRPIHHLRRAFAALAQGELTARVGPLIGTRRDEIADLGHDFDSMAQRLQLLIHAQRTLLHEVSHELRSPLARLAAAIGLARQRPEETEAALERVEREAMRVDELIGELLTLSRIEARLESDTELDRCDLVDLAASIAVDAQFEAQASGREVAFRGEGEVIACARIELLHRAFENVVRNAIKFTAEGTTVEVDSGLDGGVFHFRVADRGPGVEENEREAIFEPFYRGAGGAARGFGLGLAIAKRAVEAHGGRVIARNREGGGLVIEIELPIREAGNA